MQINVNKKFCYRIIHRDNIHTILRDGICTKHHPKASADFVSIGNPEIIETRDTTLVKIDGYGNIGDYVPFYFTPKSMMLYNIITGYKEPLVPKRKREEIIVLRCLIKTLSEVERFFFTNGQANSVKSKLTKHYNDLSNLSEIDWQIIHDSDFKKTIEDTDKQRRYQAEFLVFNHVPTKYIESIHVYNNLAATFVKDELAKLSMTMPVKITPPYFF